MGICASRSDSQFSKEDFGLGVDGGKAAAYWVARARTPHVCDLSGCTCLQFFGGNEFFGLVSKGWMCRLK